MCIYVLCSYYILETYAVQVHCNSHVMCAQRFHCALVSVHAAFVTKCCGQLMFHLEAVVKARSEGPLKFPVPQTAQRLLSVLPSFWLVHI